METHSKQTEISSMNYEEEEEMQHDISKFRDQVQQNSLSQKVIEDKMDGLKKGVKAKMDGVEVKMNSLKKGVEAKMDGIEEKLKGNMEYLKIYFTKFLTRNTY